MISSNSREISIQFQNVTNNIEKAMGESAVNLVRFAKSRTKSYASTFKDTGELEKSIYSREFKEAKKGFVTVPPNEAMIGLANELGQRERFVPFSEAPNLEAWAARKALRFIGGKGLVVGGKNSRVKLGQSRNIFFQPAFNDLVNNAEMIVRNEFNKKNIT